MPSSNSLSPNPSDSYKTGLFFYEFVCFWSIIDLQHCMSLIHSIVIHIFVYFKMIMISHCHLPPYPDITLIIDIFPILYISYLWLIYFVTEMYLLTSLTYFSLPHPTLLWQPPVCSQYLWLFLFNYICSYVLFLRFHVQVKSYSIYLYLTYFTQHNILQVKLCCH